MHVRLIGDADDVTGLGLAGLDSLECRSRADVVQALDAARADPGVAVVVLSHGAAVLVEDLLGTLADAARLPLTIVLPPRPALNASEGTGP